MKRPLVITLVIAIAVLFSAGAALAVSDGNYDPAKQGCSGSADNSESPDRVEPGCRSIQITVSDGSNTYVSGGTQQTPDHTNVHEATGTAGPCTGTLDVGITNGEPPVLPPDGNCDGTLPNPQDASGAHLYVGADDNLSGGEHDSSEQINNGPSDGGAIQANVDPASVALWIAEVSAGNTQYLLTNPVPVADFGVGMCADGYCAAVTTKRRVAYQGSGDGSRDLANYEGKEWDPYSCGGPSDHANNCGGEEISYWNGKDGTVYAEPGVQVYEDPDPQGSPLDPIHETGLTDDYPLYPIPSAYAGTCGVVAGGGSASAPAGTPGTNSAGQVVVKTDC